VVGVFDFGTNSGGQMYFAMEYVDGSDVSQMIATQGKLPPEHALAITAHVCDALSAAHELGIVHRDIKPANVLINMKGQVKVADFGLAKIEDPGQHGLTKTGYAMGTPDFVAPEALTLGAAIDGRADLYAVGVMLYQMLTGNIPRGAFKPASVLVPGLDPRFDPIILKAMQHDRAERHQSAAELRRELDVILTVPFVRNDAPASAAIPVAQMAQAPGQRSAAQKPQPWSAGAPTRQPSVKAGEGTRAPETPSKSKTPLFIGLGVAAAIGIGAFVMMGGKKEAKQSGPLNRSAAEIASQGLPEGRAERGNPLSGTSVPPQATKPAQGTVRTTISPPEPAKPQPKPAPTTVTSSPSLPLSKSSDPKFPPGKWVKVITQFADLPGVHRQAESGVKWENARLTTSKNTYWRLPAELGMRNGGIRFTATKESKFELRIRDHGTRFYALKNDKTLVHAATAAGGMQHANLASSQGTRPSKDEMTWEIAAVGNRVMARIDSELIGPLLDDRISDGHPSFANLLGTVRDIEVINLDGLSEAEALKILGVDEKGNDLRKPAVVAATTPAPSASPSSPQFPPGQWVKVFTKLEDLPVDLRKAGLKIEDGWIRVRRDMDNLLKPAPQFTGNYAMRARFKRDVQAWEVGAIRLRQSEPKNYYQLKNANENGFICQRRADDAYITLKNDRAKRVTSSGDEYVLEFGVVGSQLIARFDESTVWLMRDTKPSQGDGLINGSEDVRDIEVINLDGLPEAEALKILGVDEKGNDLRALAAKQEQQIAEQAKVVDAMAAIPELKALHEQFVKLQAERVTAPFEAEVAKLNAGYVGGIDREIANEKKAGHLDGVIALEAEKKLIADKQPIPAEDEATTTDALKKLRGIYRAAYAKIEAARAENLKALTDPLSIRLKQIEAELTKKDRVPDAKTVREYREALGRADGPPSAASGPATANTPNTAIGGPSALPKKKFPPGDDRKAAEWVLSVGGSVGLAGISTRIIDAADLPRGRFEVASVYLEFSVSKQPMGPINDLMPLAGLKHLARLHLKEVPVEETHLEIVPSLPALATLRLEKTGIGDGLFVQLDGSMLQSLEFAFEPRITGEGISALRSCKELVSLQLTGCLPTEEGLRQIGSLETLTRLSLPHSYTRLKDEHLPLLVGLKKLKILNLQRTQVTAEGLAALKTWSGLTLLGFDPRPGQAAPQVIVLAAAFPKLEHLALEGDPTAPCSAEELRALNGFPRLRKVGCSGSLFTDEVLSGLLAVDGLEDLVFTTTTKLTDASLDTVAKLRKLKRLEITNCPNLTDAAIAAFQKERPDVTVTK
jgi:serine/threonine protein kinase